MEQLPLKDIAIAVMGGAGSIGAVLLVFVGFLIMKVEGLPDTTPNRVLAKYRYLAKFGIVPLLALIGVMMAAYWWLLGQHCTAIYLAWSLGFFVATGLFVVYSIAAIWMV